jgi:serine/threonine-protein kinase
MRKAMLGVGEEVSGTYRVVRRVGEGGMGEVYEVRHLRLAGRYALKVLRSEAANEPDALRRFQREAEVTSDLRHPNIVQVTDFSTLPNGSPYLVMEFIAGEELASVIARQGRLGLSTVVSYTKQIAAGLAAAHEKHVVHRDLKPQNLFVSKVIGHDSDLVKIVDFGISKVKDPKTNLTQNATIMGTVQYMSPEQAHGRIAEIDERTDQFALAAIVYELLVGKEAFTGDTVPSVLYQVVNETPPALQAGDSSLPGPIADVLRRALAKKKDQRYATVLEFSAALEHAAAETAGGVPRQPPTMILPADLEPASPVAPGPNRPPTTLGATASESLRNATVPGSRRKVAVVGIGAALAVIGVVAWTMRGSAPRVGSTVGSTTGSTVPPVEASTAVAPPPPSKPPVPAELPSPPPVVPSSPAATTTPADAPPSRPKPPAPPAKSLATEADGHGPRRRKSSGTPHGAAKASCNPPYTLDSDGEKHFKPECFAR